ncbi:TMEM175 family protein [Agromyces sp. NPDC057865]|uniref:TMEM175 family protein n=1 Tax=Agromyces sp. NPDC057865 TaxID=3346267 RepID=UPI003672A62E
MPKGEMRERRRTATRSDTSRAVAFSDAVIAIVITLLVLDLRPPKAEPGGLLSALLGEWPTYLAYAASYIYLAVIWLNHKAAFSRIREMDRGLQWANLGILATLALVPWPTAVIAETARTGNLEDERVAVGLYAIVGALLCLSWLVFFSYLARHADLTKEEVDDSFFARERPRALIGVVLYLAAGTAGILIHPLVASVIFLLLPAFYGFTSHGLDHGPGFLRRGVEHGDVGRDTSSRGTGDPGQ